MKPAGALGSVLVVNSVISLKQVPYHKSLPQIGSQAALWQGPDCAQQKLKATLPLRPRGSKATAQKPPRERTKGGHHATRLRAASREDRVCCRNLRIPARRLRAGALSDAQSGSAQPRAKGLYREPAEAATQQHHRAEEPALQGLYEKPRPRFEARGRVGLRPLGHRPAAAADRARDHDHGAPLVEP